MRLRLSFTFIKSNGFKNAGNSEAFSKRYSFIVFLNRETTSIWKRLCIFAKQVGSQAKSKHCEPRTECSTFLYSHIQKHLENG